MYRDLNKKKAAEKAWRERNKIKCVWQHLRGKAKRQKLDFNLEVSDLLPMLSLEVCPVFEYRLANHNNKGDQDMKASVDRIDPTRGYTKDNIRFISGRANRIKSDASLVELKALVNWLEQKEYHL